MRSNASACLCFCAVACVPVRTDPGVLASSPLTQDAGAVVEATGSPRAPAMPAHATHPLQMPDCTWPGAWHATFDLPPVRAVASASEHDLALLTETTLLHLSLHEPQGNPTAAWPLQGVADDPVALARLPQGWALADGTRARVVLLDEAGKITAETSEGLPGDFLRAMAAVPDGGIAACGSLSRDPTTTADDLARVLRLDSQGKPLWDHTYPPALAAEAIAAMPDGGLYVLGRQPPAALPQSWLARLDAEGVPIWTWTYGIHASGQAVAVTVDGGAIVSIDATFGYQGDCTALVAGVSPTGLTLWTQCLGAGQPGLTLPRGVASGAMLLTLAQTSAKGLARVTLEGRDFQGLALWSAHVADWGESIDSKGQQVEHGLVAAARTLQVLPNGSWAVAGDAGGKAWLAVLPARDGCLP